VSSNAWNEWAEGKPSGAVPKVGGQYLRATEEVLMGSQDEAEGSHAKAQRGKGAKGEGGLVNRCRGSYGASAGGEGGYVGRRRVSREEGIKNGAVLVPDTRNE